MSAKDSLLKTIFCFLLILQSFKDLSWKMSEKLMTFELFYSVPSRWFALQLNNLTTTKKGENKIVLVTIYLDGVVPVDLRRLFWVLLHWSCQHGARSVLLNLVRSRCHTTGNYLKSFTTLFQKGLAGKKGLKNPLFKILAYNRCIF